METKRYWAALQLLDRQIVDRDGRMAGNVDDVELEQGDDGTLWVRGLLSGPGTLLRRLEARRLGDWLRHAHERLREGDDDPARIPLARVADIGDHVTVSLRHEEMATSSGERWVRDHLIGRIPGSRHEASSE
jgi:sporulation protein YlmC with PRC-barrel domain